jgi:hypothetical protein
LEVINETKKSLKYPSSPIPIKREFTIGSAIVCATPPNEFPNILP